MVRRTSFLCLLIGIFPALCCAQNAQESSTPPAASQPPAPAAAPKDPSGSATLTEKSKKVWTNEDVKTTGGVSVIGDQRNQKYTMTKPPDPALVAKYKGNLQKLQTQLADVNKQLKAFEDFKEGKPVSEGGQDMSHGYSRIPVNQQTAKLLDKRQQLEAQIDALYEEARKKGIESGLLK